MELGLTSKVAWVLGGSAGIGRAAGEELAREGARVAISSRNHEVLKREAAAIAETTGAECIAVPTDVTDPGAITSGAERVARELGPVDVLVSNAGGPPAGQFDSLGEDELNHAFNLTLASAWRLTKAVLPAMKERKSGVLVYITSTSAKEPIPNLMLSNMMRPAIVGMAKTISKEMGPYGIRTICIAPGRIATDRSAELDAATAARTGRSVDEVSAETKERAALGRYGEPAELARVIAFLASDRASYVTGVTTVVDGGMAAGLLS